MNEATLKRFVALMEEEKENATPEHCAEVDLRIERVKRRAGRKKLPADRLRSNRVMTYLNAGELERLRNVAGERDLAEVVRELALEAADARLAKNS